VAGVLALLAATVTSIIEIRVVTTTQVIGTDTQLSGWDRHGPALALLAAFALAMALGAARGARPAMTALAICGLATLAIATLNDLPDLDRTGQVGRLYADAQARPGPGYYLETAGGALLLLAGGSLLLLGTPGRRERVSGGYQR